MMTDVSTGHFQSIVLQPYTEQLVTDRLPAIVLYCVIRVYDGTEGLSLAALVASVIALLSLALPYRFVYLRRAYYHIGDEQLISRHGVLSRETDYMEQYCIMDFMEHQSLMQQLYGPKTVRIFSMDRSISRLNLIGIRYNFDVVMPIQERVEYNKRKKGIYEITNHQSDHLRPLPNVALGRSSNCGVRSVGMDGVDRGQRGYQ